jgi:putative peptidoglycan lipid II flippase
MIPRILALSALQINFVVITAIASTLNVGSVAIFNYANNLQSFPQGIIGISFAVAAFPALSLLIAQNRREDFIKNFSSTTRQILFFIIPLSIIFLLLRAQIVRIVLGTGAFDWNATVSTADALAFFSLGLFAQALLPLFIRAYYALEDTKTPFFISLLAVAINIFLSLWFTKWHYQMGAPGLALSFTLSGILNFILLWVFLRFKVSSLDEGRIIPAVFKFTVAGIFMGIVIQLSKNFIAPYVDMQSFWGIFTQGVVAGLLGSFTYIIIGLILKCHEMKIFVATIKDKLVRTKNLPPDISEINEV